MGIHQVPGSTWSWCVDTGMTSQTMHVVDGPAASSHQSEQPLSKGYILVIFKKKNFFPSVSDTLIKINNIHYVRIIILFIITLTIWSKLLQSSQEWGALPYVSMCEYTWGLGTRENWAHLLSNGNRGSMAGLETAAVPPLLLWPTKETKILRCAWHTHTPLHIFSPVSSQDTLASFNALTHLCNLPMTQPPNDAPWPHTHRFFPFDYILDFITPLLFDTLSLCCWSLWFERRFFALRSITTCPLS